ncbi:hypothetical protein KEF85_14925 [Methylomonas paludis]|uniref:Uncharacterized protein n=1 Tax=Methylomonas paludis TaxID=1173101 RepID=A0A975MNI4_9GAMM|nr:hypothetical protein [Methylomonas paludis]QWF70599.1 hypothetical protein KEF85_14925 [Methylomonas paludis]
MVLRQDTVIKISLLALVLLQACGSTRQLAVDYPKTEITPLKPLKGQAGVAADDYYVQLISEFEFKGGNALKNGCSDMGSHYENADISAALLFNVRNDAIKLKQEVSGFLYQAAIGTCHFKLETKKANLTPWLRLDAAKDTQLDYSFLTSNSHDSNLSQVVNDVNAAGNLLALTGVGTGVAVMGKLAGTWVDGSQQAAVKAPPATKVSSETHTLPAYVQLSGDSGSLVGDRLPVYQVIDGGAKFWTSEASLLGELRIYPEITPALLLKTGSDGLPDAHDLSLPELWHVPIQSAGGQMPLRQVLDQLNQADKPNLQPDWQNYSQVESQCRQLKLVMKDLGFNKYDRDAVLYYFLNQSPDWKNFNISQQLAMTDQLRPKLLEQYHSNGFAGCLADEDYIAMKNMKLSVNTPQDWEQITSSRLKKEGVINTIQALARQLLAAVKNPDKDEMTHQLYPLLNTDKSGNGSVLVQNHLSNFGLEAMLQVPVIPDEGVVINAGQLAAMFLGLNVESYSCARPAQEQGQPLANIGIILFATKPGSPREKGGALEFELVQGKIVRITLQHPAFRDFEQNIADYPDLGGCRIEADLLNSLH